MGNAFAVGFGIPNTKPISNTNFNAIIVAASQTGADSATMFAISDLVSSFNETLISNNNTGLYQFPASLWSSMLVQYGYIYNIPDLPTSITNPLFNSYLGGQLIVDIITLLQDRYSVVAPTAGQIYLFFFMGIFNGPQLLVASQKTPSALAASLFPGIASANTSVFFNSDGSSKTVLQVYNYLTTLANNKATAYSGQYLLLPPCMRGNGVNGFQTSLPNVPSGKINSTNVLSSALSLIGRNGWISNTASIDSTALVQSVNGLGATSTWVQGIGNLVANPPAIGIAVATFQPDGTYGNISDVSHAAIYLGPSDDGTGIKVLDQWGLSLTYPQGQQAAIRDILGNPANGFVNYAKNYFVINILQ